MKECKYCCECLYYSFCKRNKEVSEVTHMTCYHNYCFMTSNVCCDFFKSRKIMEDIEEPKNTEPAYEPDYTDNNICSICLSCNGFFECSSLIFCDKNRSECCICNPCDDYDDVPF